MKDAQQQILLIFSPESERDINRIYCEVDSLSSMTFLQTCLDDLVKQGKLKEIYRVIGPYGNGLEDFESREDIPDTMEDDTGEGDFADEPTTFRVNDSRIKVIYKRAS